MNTLAYSLSLFLFCFPSFAQDDPKQACNTGKTEACLIYAEVLRARGDTNEASAILNDICKKQSKLCYQMAEVMGYSMNFEGIVALYSALCNIKNEVACKKLPEMERERAKLEKRKKIVGGRQITENRAGVAQVRKKSKTLPVSYNLKDSRWNWDALEKQISSKRLLNKKIYFPVTRCGPFIPSDNHDKWAPIVECTGGSERVWYKIVVDERLSIELPKRFPAISSNPVTWFTGTVVELRPTGVVDALVIVID